VGFPSLLISFCVTQLGLTRIYHVRWEFLTTLDYEWRVISGRVRYRWSLWVCCYGCPFSAPLSYLKVNMGLICSVSFGLGLLLYAPQRTRICDLEHHLPRPDDRSNLSGHISCLPLYIHILTNCNPKVMATLTFVSIPPPHTPQSSMRARFLSDPKLSRYFHYVILPTLLCWSYCGCMFSTLPFSDNLQEKVFMGLS
jgi:hypothetical protein